MLNYMQITNPIYAENMLDIIFSNYTRYVTVQYLVQQIFRYISFRYRNNTRYHIRNNYSVHIGTVSGTGIWFDTYIGYLFGSIP